MACNYEPVAQSDDGLAWELRGQGVKCMTENDIIAADGSATATGKTSPIAQKWADMMTEKYDQLAGVEPIFGQSFGGPGFAFSKFIGACGRPVIM